MQDLMLFIWNLHKCNDYFWNKQKKKKLFTKKIWCNTQIFKLPIRIPAKAAKYHPKHNHEKESKRLQKTFAKSVLQLKCMHSRKCLSSMACVTWFSHVLRTTGTSKLHALQNYWGLMTLFYIRNISSSTAISNASYHSLMKEKVKK